MRRAAALIVALLVLPLVPAVILATPAGAVVCTRTPGDINADGFADLVLGQPYRNVGTNNGAGAVNVLRGTALGVTTVGDRFIDETGIGGTAQSLASMGAATATGWFDDDCYADVAIGVPGYDNSRGAVAVFHGTAGGLDTTTPTLFRAATIVAPPTGGASFGEALAAGDFNHDGRDDLAVGVEGVNSQAGEIIELFGSAGGLTAAGARFYDEDSPGVPGSNGAGDRFGASMTAADFNADGYADLAVSAIGETVNGQSAAGSVTVLPGSADGLTGTGSRVFTQHTAGVPGTAEKNDSFGVALAAADVTGDGHPDLAIGSPVDRVGSISNSGTVTLLRGTATGLTATGAQMWTEDSPGVPDTVETNDLFGFGLAAGDFDGDGHADLAIGAPGESVGTVKLAGAVIVLYGRSTGLTASGAQEWTQNSPGVGDSAEATDVFGLALQALPIRGGPRDSLVIQVPLEDSSGFTNNGAVEILPADSHGLTSTNAQSFDASILTGGAQSGAELGYATIT